MGRRSVWWGRKTGERFILRRLWGAQPGWAGLMASLTWDTPAGPSIVVVVTVLFAECLVVGKVPNGQVG